MNLPNGLNHNKLQIKLMLPVALVLFSVLILFWGALYLGEKSVRPPNNTNNDYVEYQSVNSAGEIDPNSKTYKAYYSNDPIYHANIESGGKSVAFRIPFFLYEPNNNIAFYLAATPGLQEIRFNGSIIQPNIPLDTLRGAADGKAVYYILPIHFQKKGANLIQVFVETQSSVIALAPYNITSATDAAKATNMVEFITNYIPTISISFLVFAILLCLVINWPEGDKLRIKNLIILLSLWSLRTYFITFQTPFEIPFLITSFIYYFLDGSVIIAFARTLIIDISNSKKLMQVTSWLWMALVAYLIIITIAGFIIGPQIRIFFKALALFHSIMAIIIVLGGLISQSIAIIIHKDGRWFERVALMICLIAMAVDAGDSAFDLVVPFHPELPLTFYTASIAGLALALGIITSIASEASEARKTVTQSNSILAARLEEQDNKLAKSYEAQKQMLQRQIALEERQRIVRDMHDGIGGQLLGLLMQVRSTDVDKKQIEESLQSSMADLRLIVDSMDSDDESLAQTMRSFEHRVRSQVEASGMNLLVRNEIKETEPSFGPRSTLQILRLLQEAITNAMRHSFAKNIVLESYYYDNGKIIISIKDDGKGFPDNIQGGRGLSSMRNRAQTIGGILEIVSGESGTILTLKLPKPAQ